ncbi:MAG: membrane protein insertion efficiency factor YidD [Saprospiraceae bacterium]|nr:membrane protein insertion efficiency factor YidD [Saprospiraceae bacterium]
MKYLKLKFIKYLFILPVKAYQKLISPLLGPSCRYNPTCSQYMIEAIEEWGVFKGIWLGLNRIGRCHPWGGMGNDPVPKRHLKNTHP